MSQSQFAMGSSSSVLLWSFSCIHLSLTCVLFRLSGGVCGLELWIWRCGVQASPVARQGSLLHFVSANKLWPRGPLARVCLYLNLPFLRVQFPRTWKTTRIPPFPKIAHPKSEADYRPLSLIRENLHARLSSATDRTSGNENELPILVKKMYWMVFSF